ncbi:hypothetical protein [uncultured Prevotella sp.]|uniref:hypothetical protein n=1 Tax=uncultured Prevotella sp. TaxID=159272 RepID=UPI0025D0A702|nr:hypothetical protein [uncultured Prevotella sp.]
MKQKTIKLLMLAGTMILANTMLMSCSDDDSSSSPSTNVDTYNYQYQVSAGGNQSLFYIDSLQANVVSVTASKDWIKVTPATVETGQPCVQLNVDEITGEKMREGYFVATDEKGNTAKVNICQYPAGEGDLRAGGNDTDWFTDWDKFQKIKVVGITDSINTPWNNDIWSNPETAASPLVTHISKDQGWEMAFSYLNNPNAPNTRYFGLYNRYLGIMRVFCYVPTGQVPGGEAYFEVIYGSASPTHTYYPFYNSLGYSIPSNKTAADLNYNVDMVEMGSQTFHNLVTPYTQSLSKVITVGWNVFDINMNGYVPKGMEWHNQKDFYMFFIKMVNRQVSNVELEGVFSGALDGKMWPASIIASGGGSTTDGICGVLGTLNTIASGVAGTGPGGYARDMMSWNKFKGEGGGATSWNRFMMGAKTYAGYASIGLTIASGIFKALGNEYPTYYDTIPGKINMTLNGTINLSGKITSWGSNNSAGLSIKKEALQEMNMQGHVGEGIISLAEDPVICVAKEDMMSDVDLMLLNIQSDGRYKNTDIENYGLRLIAFLDPTSIKLNLNTDLFKDLGGVTEVVVTPTWGVYPDTKHGSTDAMRKAINLEPRPVISLKGTQVNGNLVLNTTTSPIRLHEILEFDLMNTEIEDPETVDNCKIVDGTNKSFHFYGRKELYGGKNVMVQPQIYVPYKDGYAYDAEVPDIVVGVTVSFHVKNANPTTAKPYDCFIYQLQYVPKIKLVSREELKTYLTLLKDCKKRWQPNVEIGEQEYPAGHLENDKSVPFYMPAICLQKSIDMLEKVTK